MPRGSRRHDNVLDLRHVATGGRGGLLRGAPALASVHVRRIPVPPVVRWGDRLERAVMLGRFMQELCKSRNVHRSHPAREPLLDLLQQPTVAVGIAERGIRGVGTALGSGPGKRPSLPGPRRPCQTSLTSTPWLISSSRAASIRSGDAIRPGDPARAPVVRGGADVAGEAEQMGFDQLDLRPRDLGGLPESPWFAAVPTLAAAAAVTDRIEFFGTFVSSPNNQPPLPGRTRGAGPRRHLTRTLPARHRETGGDLDARILGREPARSRPRRPFPEFAACRPAAC